MVQIMFFETTVSSFSFAKNIVYTQHHSLLETFSMPRYNSRSKRISTKQKDDAIVKTYLSLASFHAISKFSSRLTTTSPRMLAKITEEKNRAADYFQLNDPFHRTCCAHSNAHSCAFFLFFCLFFRTKIKPLEVINRLCLEMLALARLGAPSDPPSCV